MSGKTEHFLFPKLLLLIGLLTGLSGCGWATGTAGPASVPAGKPGKVQIEIDQVNDEKTKPVVTTTNVGTVQKLYTMIYTLPQVPENQACTDELGPHYTLTFYQDAKKLVTIKAERDGCRPISIEGEKVQRSTSTEFWALLDQAITEGAPPVHPQGLLIMRTDQLDQPVQSAQNDSAAVAQQFYDAILALPRISDAIDCVPETPPLYQFGFRIDNETIRAALNKSCQTITISGNDHVAGGTFKTDEQFMQLLNKTVEAAVFEPARPDKLVLSLISKETSMQSHVAGAELVQNLYKQFFSLPSAPSSGNCPSDTEKAAGTGKFYTLNFSQWDLPILTVEVYEGTCTHIAMATADNIRLGDQAFWDLLHDAAK
jgi:hypothetical protein